LFQSVGSTYFCGVQFFQFSFQLSIFMNRSTLAALWEAASSLFSFLCLAASSWIMSLLISLTQLGGGGLLRSSGPENGDGSSLTSCTCGETLSSSSSGMGSLWRTLTADSPLTLVGFALIVSLLMMLKRIGRGVGREVVIRSSSSVSVSGRFLAERGEVFQYLISAIYTSVHSFQFFLISSMRTVLLSTPVEVPVVCVPSACWKNETMIFLVSSVSKVLIKWKPYGL